MKSQTQELIYDTKYWIIDLHQDKSLKVGPNFFVFFISVPAYKTHVLILQVV